MLTTTIKHYEGLSEYFDQNKLLPRSLVNGHMEPVKKIAIDANFSFSKYQTKGNPTRNALVLSLNEDRYDRVVGLLEAASARLTNKHEHGRSMGKHTEPVDQIRTLGAIICSTVEFGKEVRGDPGS